MVTILMFLFKFICSSNFRESYVSRPCVFMLSLIANIRNDASIIGNRPIAFGGLATETEEILIRA